MSRAALLRRPEVVHPSSPGIISPPPFGTSPSCGSNPQGAGTGTVTFRSSHSARRTSARAGTSLVRNDLHRNATSSPLAQYRNAFFSERRLLVLPLLFFDGAFLLCSLTNPWRQGIRKGKLAFLTELDSLGVFPVRRGVPMSSCCTKAASLEPRFSPLFPANPPLPHPAIHCRLLPLPLPSR